MTAMVQNSSQFDMERGLSKDKRLSRVQQAAQNQIHSGVTRHGGPGAFNFKADIDAVKTVSKNKKIGATTANSVSGNIFAEVFCSVEGNTTTYSQLQGRC